MSDLICRQSMTRCKTPGMCSPYGGCQPESISDGQHIDLGKFIDHVWALKAERDQLKAENEALRKALDECADSLHGEMLQKFGGQLPDDMHPVTRREYDRDMAEVAGYRAAMGKGEQS